MYGCLSSPTNKSGWKFIAFCHALLFRKYRIPNHVITVSAQSLCAQHFPGSCIDLLRLALILFPLAWVMDRCPDRPLATAKERLETIIKITYYGYHHRLERIICGAA